MGVDHSVYCGPYVKCKWQGVKAEKLVFYCAAEVSHPVDKKDKYCSTCGGEVWSKTVTTDKIVSDVDWRALEKELDDRLYEVTSMGGPLSDDNICYLISNKRDDGLNREASFGKYDVGVLEISSELIEDEIAVFKNFFTNDLKILKKYFKQVDVAWGLLASCS